MPPADFVCIQLPLYLLRQAFPLLLPEPTVYAGHCMGQSMVTRLLQMVRCLTSALQYSQKTVVEIGPPEIDCYLVICSNTKEECTGQEPTADGKKYPCWTSRP
jgi:hypothetical protein